MIFVTVGTHEQPFDRLIKYMDRWAASHEEKVIIQTGCSDYEPVNCDWYRTLSYDNMIKNIQEARVVITHGGPGSFMLALQIGKKPIIVPRRKKFGEHVNDHQVNFCNQLKNRLNSVVVVNNICKLEKAIDLFDEKKISVDHQVKSNTEHFISVFNDIVEGMFSC